MGNRNALGTGAVRLRSQARRAFGGLPGSDLAAQWFLSAAAPPASGYALDRLRQVLPAWVEAAAATRRSARLSTPRKVLLIAAYAWWVEYVTAVALMLAAVGHHVSLGLFPYRSWSRAAHPIDLRHQARYLMRALGPIEPMVHLVDLHRSGADTSSNSLVDRLQRQSLVDVQYTLQREELDLQAPGERGRCMRSG